MDGEDIRMRKRCHGFCLALESGTSVRILGKCIRQDFDCYLSFQSCITCTVHHSHAAGAERGDYFIRT